MERGSKEEGKRKKEDGWRGVGGKKEKENEEARIMLGFQGVLP